MTLDAVSIVSSTRRGLAGCVVAALAATACGGSGGEATKPAKTIVADAARAANAATSVHVRGTVSAQGQNVPVDLRIGPAGAVGTGSFAGTKVDIVRSGDSLYVRGAQHVLGGFLGAKAAAAIGNHWVQIPLSIPQLAQFAGLADKTQLVKQLLTPAATPVKAGTRTVGDQRTVVVDGFGGDGKSALLVAANATPYPVELTGPSGTLTFSAWNAPVTVTKPTDVVPLTQLTG